MISDFISTITNSLPLPRFGKWDVQVLKTHKKEEESDKTKLDILNSTLKTVSSFVSDSINKLFGTDQKDEKFETIASFDTLVSVNGIQESKIVSQAIEKGSFRSVNKIEQPDIINIQLAKGGFYKGIENSLENLKSLEKSTTICRVITPFGIFDNLNLLRLNYTFKKETGANLLIADLQFQEIKSSVQKEPFNYKNLKNPTDSDTVNAGQKVAK